MQSLKTTRIFAIAPDTGSSHDILTGEYSGKPYLSTDIKIPAATFFSRCRGMCSASLLRWNSLLFSLFSRCILRLISVVRIVQISCPKLTRLKITWIDRDLK